MKADTRRNWSRGLLPALTADANLLAGIRFIGDMMHASGDSLE